MNQDIPNESPRVSNWKGIYTLGAIATLLVLAGTILDIVAGSITGGNLTAHPQTAADRFIQFQDNRVLALYNLDLLNVIIQVLMIPVYVALFGAHRKNGRPAAFLSLMIFMAGTILFVAGNVALPMYELSVKYASAASESERMLYAAAGEGLLARGIHGSLGVFIAFLLLGVAGILISWVMLKGRVFTRLNAWLGLIGGILITLYIILVTFFPAVQGMATAFAAPGGLLLIGWMVLFMVKLFQLGRGRKS